MLKVNEIFYSIQGEGANAGMPCTFVRLAGCNRNCEFCDTSHEDYTGMTLLEVVKRVEKNRCYNVVITGGEPTLQKETFDLAAILKKALYYVAIETNGTIDFKSAAFNYVTVSPKDKKIKKNNCDECKVVWTGKENLKWFEKHMLASKFYLQPCSMKNIEECVKIVKENPRWRLSLQCQKLIGVR